MAQQPRPGQGQEPSPYPWSMRPLTFTVPLQNQPFPRYGAAVNATSSKDGSVYLMGGLINGSTVKGDLWMVEAGTNAMSCYPVATTSEGPGPRVGHASLLVGNAFIVFGGDTKMEEGDMLDDTLYLLNTCEFPIRHEIRRIETLTSSTATKQWSRALPAGPRPPGRYGHTLNILGSKIYVFGGQVEGFFFNDLVAFDLNALQQAQNRWEILIQNTIDGGPPHGQIPPARTNHTMVTYGDKLFLFGGTDGVHWFNDVWSYSPHTNSWTQLECIGYIPSPREGHAAAIVNDVMYIFGGRTEEGNDLGDLAAFRIGSKRWYTFQNMGPSPSPRSGHSMTTVGKSIVVLAGEPSSAPRDAVELSHGYFLDTSKIRYPPDAAAPQQQTPQLQQSSRRPSGEKSSLPTPSRSGSRDLMDSPRMGSNPDLRGRSESVKSENSASRLPQAPRLQGQLPAPTGPPPQPPQQRANGVQSRQPTRPDRTTSPAADTDPNQVVDRAAMSSPQGRPMGAGMQEMNILPLSPSFTPERSYYESDQPDQPRTYKPETYQPSQEQADRSSSRNQKTAQPELNRIEETPRVSEEIPEQMPKVRELQQDDGPQDSGIGSSPALTMQYDHLLRELEQTKQRNAWYASELALARKSGYQTRAAESPVMDERATDVFGDDDKPLIEALLKMKAELARVQQTIDEQSKNAAERIAEMQKQRDAAISEAVYAKTRLAGQGSSLAEGGDLRSSSEQDRSNDMGRRLASSLNAQSELSRRIDSLIQDVESEKRARELAEETAEAAQKRVQELDTDRQQHASGMESLRADLHEAQRSARDASASHAELKSQHDLLSIDKRDVDDQLESALADTQNHSAILISLQEAVKSSHERAQRLEEKLDDERGQRDSFEEKLRSLRAEHEERTAELESTSRQLRDAQEMADSHAEEAKNHRGAVLAGLGKLAERGTESSKANDDRVRVLEAQVENANSMVRDNQMAADSAADKLRRAEERIAGLEAFQDQASREGLSIRKQLQAAMKENQSLSAHKAELEQHVQSQALEKNALAVQHASLRDILGERGINAAEVRRSRAIDSPNSLSRFSTPDLARVRELEQQLESSLKSHDEMKVQFEEVSDRDEKMKKEYEDKLTALDNDHQAAVKYLRGTEKMLSKMKQELQRVKDENRELKKKVDRAKDEGEASKRDVPDDWEEERERLKKEVAETQANLKSSVEQLEGRLDTMQQQLQNAENDLHETRTSHATSQADLSTLQMTHTQSRNDFDKLQKENTILEERARDAENKVQLLLDQVESSVDNYRRQSRMAGDGIPTMNGTFHHRPLSGLSEATQTPNHTSGHSRSQSDGNASIISDTTMGVDGRNSMALDSLASELDALRSHWETTQNYRLSDRFDFEHTPTTSAHPTTASGDFGSSLANWRQGLSLDDDDDKSRPTTRDGSAVRDGEVDAGQAVTTPTQATMI